MIKSFLRNARARTNVMLHIAAAVEAVGLVIRGLTRLLNVMYDRLGRRGPEC